MSLTSMLNGQGSNLKEFQNIIRTNIPQKLDFYTLSEKTAFSAKVYDIKAPNNLSNQYNASIVGISFDYLARVMIARILKNKKSREKASRNLVASKGLEIIKKVIKSNEDLQIKIINQFNTMLNEFKSYTNNNSDIKKMIPIAYYFAKLEQIARTRMLPENIEESLLGEPEQEIVEDLKNICKVFQKEFINKRLVTPTSKVIFNPNFGVGSIIVDGADGDVYIDGVLYDFKTTKSVGYKWKEVAQLVGYYYLDQLSKEMKKLGVVYGDEELQIETIAFYRARYGEVEAFDVGKYKESYLKSVIQQLIDYFNKHPTKGILFNPRLHETIITLGEERNEISEYD